MPVASLSTETLVLDDPALPVVGVDPARVEDLTDPVEDRYLVRLDPPIDRSKGGILLPDQSLPLSRTGTVVRAGAGGWCDDGKTRLPMKACAGPGCRADHGGRPHAARGQRILFEYAAGYTLPRVPEKTSGRERGYLLVRDGSVLAIIDPPNAGQPSAWPEFVDDAEKVIPRLQLVQDWLLVHNDRPQSEYSAGLSEVKRTRFAGRGARINGRRVILTPTSGSQIQGSERWTGTVVRRGPGLLTITRCLDGDRVGTARHLCEEGDRVLYTTAFPLMSIPGVDGYALVRERPCLEAVLGR